MAGLPAPPLSTEEYDALKASIKADGVRDPVVIDEDGNVLDGHHRYEINPKAPTRTIKGSGKWSEAERRAYAIGVNFERRHLSPEQRADVAKEQKKIAGELREAGKTQAEIGRILRVSRQWVTKWLATDISSATNGEANNPPLKINLARKITPDEEEQIVSAVEDGETQTGAPAGRQD